MRVRRTKEEIAAGLTVKQKSNGLGIADLIVEPVRVETKEQKYYSGKRIRRTLEEKEAGLTLDEKRMGKTLEEKLSEHIKNSSISSKGPTKEALEKMNDDLEPVEVKSLTYKDKTEIDKNQHDWKGDTKLVINKEIEYIKEIVFVEEGKNKKLVRDIIKNELYKCKREWKQIKMDKSFGSVDLNKLGDKGWTYAFILSPSIFNDSKDLIKYPDIMYLHRVKPK